MAKLMHESRRGPGEYLLVNGEKIELDAEGCVEVSEEAAKKLLMGSKWRSSEHWAGRSTKIAAATPPPAPAGGARRVRTKEELEATADAAGIPLKEEAQVADQIIEETIEVSEDMTRGELSKIAQEAGYRVTRSMSKRQILDLFDESE